MSKKSATPANRHKTGVKLLKGGHSPEIGQATQFGPGKSGNPSGRPKRARLDDALVALFGQIEPDTGKTYAELLAERVMKKAINGDLKAAQLAAERAQGKPAQKIELDGTLATNPADRTEELLKLAADRAASAS